MQDGLTQVSHVERVAERAPEETWHGASVRFEATRNGNRPQLRGDVGDVVQNHDHRPRAAEQEEHRQALMVMLCQGLFPPDTPADVP